MVHCCVPNCSSDTAKTEENVSFIAFPRDQSLKDKWKIAISRQGAKLGSLWSPTKASKELQDKNPRSYTKKQNSSEYIEYRKPELKDNERAQKRSKTNNPGKPEKIPVNKKMSRKDATKQECCSRRVVLPGFENIKKRASCSTDDSSSSSKKVKLQHLKESIENSSDTSYSITPEEKKNPFELAILSTCKGSNNSPLLSAKERKEQLRQEDELRQILRARRHLSESFHRKNKTAPVSVKEEASGSIPVRGLAEKRLIALKKELEEEIQAEIFKEEQAKRFKEEETERFKEEETKKNKKETKKFKQEAKYKEKTKKSEEKAKTDSSKESPKKTNVQNSPSEQWAIGTSLSYKSLKDSGSKGIAEKRLKALQEKLATQRENKEYPNSDLSLENNTEVKPATGFASEGRLNFSREIDTTKVEDISKAKSLNDNQASLPTHKIEGYPLLKSYIDQNKTQDLSTEIVLGPKPVVSGNALQDLSENHNFDESMEWETIEEEKILSHIQEVRNEIQQVGGANLDEPSISVGRKFQDSILSGASRKELFIVLDTNILISHLSYVQELIDDNIEGLSMPVLIIPWQVIQELDVIKDRKANSSLAYLARKAVNFMNAKLKTNHPRLIGQTTLDAVPKEYNKDGIPDDSILQCCLQMAETKNIVILLSNDKNLCNKAMINGIKAFQKSEIKKVLQELSLQNVNQNEVPVATGKVFATNALNVSEQHENLKDDNGQHAVNDILCKLKTLLKDLLEKVLENEMYKAFDKVWLKIVVLKPPWTLKDIITCFLKHWIAVFGCVLPRKSQFLFEDLKEFFSKIELEDYVCTVPEIKKIIEISLSVCDSIPSKDYGIILSESISNLKNLKSLCEDTNAKFSEKDRHTDLSIEAQNQDVKVIYNILEEFYNFVVIFCGVMCDLLGIQHCLIYSRPEPFPSLNDVRERFSELYLRVNLLVRSISRIREVPSHFLTVEHEAVQQLYFTFKNYFSSPEEVTPQLILNFLTSDNTRNSLTVVQTKFEEAEALLNRGQSYFMQASI